jgi:hypothetical protein
LRLARRHRRHRENSIGRNQTALILSIRNKHAGGVALG